MKSTLFLFVSVHLFNGTIRTVAAGFGDSLGSSIDTGGFSGLLSYDAAGNYRYPDLTGAKKGDEMPLVLYPDALRQMTPAAPPKKKRIQPFIDTKTGLAEMDVPYNGKPTNKKPIVDRYNLSSFDVYGGLQDSLNYNTGSQLDPSRFTSPGAAGLPNQAVLVDLPDKLLQQPHAEVAMTKDAYGYHPATTEPMVVIPLPDAGNRPVAGAVNSIGAPAIQNGFGNPQTPNQLNNPVVTGVQGTNAGVYNGQVYNTQASGPLGKVNEMGLTFKASGSTTTEPHFKLTIKCDNCDIGSDSGESHGTPGDLGDSNNDDHSAHHHHHHHHKKHYPTENAEVTNTSESEGEDNGAVSAEGESSVAPEAETQNVDNHEKKPKKPKKAKRKGFLKRLVKNMVSANKQPDNTEAKQEERESETEEEGASFVQVNSQETEVLDPKTKTDPNETNEVTDPQQYYNETGETVKRAGVLQFLIDRDVFESFLELSQDTTDLSQNSSTVSEFFSTIGTKVNCWLKPSRTSCPPVAKNESAEAPEVIEPAVAVDATTEADTVKDLKPRTLLRRVDQDPVQSVPPSPLGLSLMETDKAKESDVSDSTSNLGDDSKTSFLESKERTIDSGYYDNPFTSFFKNIYNSIKGWFVSSSDDEAKTESSVDSGSTPTQETTAQDATAPDTPLPVETPSQDTTVPVETPSPDATAVQDVVPVEACTQDTTAPVDTTTQDTPLSVDTTTQDATATQDTVLPVDTTTQDATATQDTVLPVDTTTQEPPCQDTLPVDTPDQDVTPTQLRKAEDYTSLAAQPLAFSVSSFLQTSDESSTDDGGNFFTRFWRNITSFFTGGNADDDSKSTDTTADKSVAAETSPPPPTAEAADTTTYMDTQQATVGEPNLPTNTDFNSKKYFNQMKKYNKRVKALSKPSLVEIQNNSLNSDGTWENQAIEQVPDYMLDENQGSVDYAPDSSSSVMRSNDRIPSVDDFSTQVVNNPDQVKPSKKRLNKKRRNAFLRFIDKMTSAIESLFSTDTTPVSMSSGGTKADQSEANTTQSTSTITVPTDNLGEPMIPDQSFPSEEALKTPDDTNNLPDEKSYDSELTSLETVDGVNDAVHDIVDGELGKLLNGDKHDIDRLLYYLPSVIDEFTGIEDNDLPNMEETEPAPFADNVEVGVPEWVVVDEVKPTLTAYLPDDNSGWVNEEQPMLTPSPTDIVQEVNAELGNEVVTGSTTANDATDGSVNEEKPLLTPASPTDIIQEVNTESVNEVVPASTTGYESQLIGSYSTNQATDPVQVDNNTWYKDSLPKPQTVYEQDMPSDTSEYITGNSEENKATSSSDRDPAKEKMVESVDSSITTSNTANVETEPTGTATTSNAAAGNSDDQKMPITQQPIVVIVNANANTNGDTAKKPETLAKESQEDEIVKLVHQIAQREIQHQKNCENNVNDVPLENILQKDKVLEMEDSIGDESLKEHLVGYLRKFVQDNGNDQ
ncbi:hypothetical protein BaOVIS_013350 [Babesia ovis]|uniref:Uncharacterized protein n=1 Tax=Babesia ovis TaxID=5869 RepID=A0A9W5TAR5_BABOV|nr:hypothetical protein BaOVIS_013350 [Babesia ovis]